MLLRIDWGKKITIVKLLHSARATCFHLRIHWYKFKSYPYRFVAKLSADTTSVMRLCVDPLILNEWLTIWCDLPNLGVTLIGPSTYISNWKRDFGIYFLRLFRILTKHSFVKANVSYSDEENSERKWNSNIMITPIIKRIFRKIVWVANAMTHTPRSLMASSAGLIDAKWNESACSV